VLGRIVENWLINAGELGYQAAFSQLLMSERYRVLHAPVHHPYEHGKDIVGISPDGELHAFQLKGGDIGLGELDRLQAQLFTLAGTAVTYPGVEPPRPPDRVFLITNGRLSAPARDRLRSFNDANRQRGFPAIETVERDQLVSRFVDAHGSFLPRDLRDLNKLLAIVLSTGAGPFPVREFAEMIWGIIRPSDGARRGTEATRAITSAGIFTSYATGPWQRVDNHTGVAEGWLVLAFAILRCAEIENLEESTWRSSFEIARGSAHRGLAALLDDASSVEDLVIPDFVDGLIYPARATLVCGYVAAYFLSERFERDVPELDEPVRRLLLRELDYLQMPGEAGAGFFLMIATALEVLGEVAAGVKLVLQWARGLTITNAPESMGGAPDPYHSFEEVLRLHVGANEGLEDETFVGEAYTLHIALDWFVRRDGRIVVEKLWPSVTQLHFAETRTSTPASLLSHNDPDATLVTWAPAAPASWARLVETACTVDEDKLPMRLWQQLSTLPYLPLLYPYRLTREVAMALDYMATGRCSVRLLEEDTDFT
jgi:hypothetical protein